MTRKQGRIARPLLLTAGALLPALLLGMASLAQGGFPAGARGPQPPHPRAKNLKVLKDLPEDQLIPVMRAYNAALGVKCDFCHVDRQFDSDAKPMKNAARAMITMMKDINAHQKPLKKQATCYMCHHGHPEPETKVEMEGPGR